MREKFLPLGTVCMLENATKAVMIIGYYTAAEGNNNKIFDYTSVLYPEGLMTSDQIGFFNHSQIKEVVNEGFKNTAAETFIANVKNFVKENSNN